MAKFTKTGDWYVDGFYGNDTTGTGTKENPFRTMLRAHTAAVGSYQKVICRGWFKDPIPVSKFIKWEAEGLAVMDGTGLTNSYAMNNGSFGEISGFWFFNWTGTNCALYYGSGALPVQDCRFDYCTIRQTSGGTNDRWTHLRNIYNECSFSTGSGYQLGTIIGCTFTNCSGSLSGASNTSFIVKDNIFHLCSNLWIYFPTERPPVQEFNYNCITGMLGGKTNAEWQSFGAGAYQSNGLATPVADIFNDYSVGRDSGTYWMQDYTIKPTSLVATGSSIRLEVGAKRIGYRFSATDLWNTYKAFSTNLSFDSTRGLVLLDAAQGVGDYMSNWIPVLAGGMQFDMLNLQALFVLDANGNVNQYIAQSDTIAPNSAVNQRRAFDVDFAISSNNVDAPVWKKQEFYRRIRLDGAGLGIADDNYNPAVVQIPQGSYFKIRFKLRNITV